MSHRIQVTLEDAPYERLQAESRRTGLALDELVRRAVDQAYGIYGRPGPDEFREAVDEAFGAWSGREAEDKA